MTTKKKPAITKAMTKSALFAEIAENTGLAKKDVAAVFDELNTLVERHVKKRGAGTFTLPGLLKIRSVKTPAKKAQKGVESPLWEGKRDIPAKPASVKVKVTPLKGLKDMALS